MSVITALTKDTFAEKLSQHETVVVDFWAEWCQPCKNFAKVMEQLVGEYPNVFFAAVDIEKETELAADFQIVSVPFVMVVRHKTVVYAEAGLLAMANLKELIDKALALSPEDIK